MARNKSGVETTPRLAKVADDFRHDGNDRSGSWLCENAKTLNRDRRSYSSKTVLVAQRASGFNLEVELKNIILRRVSIFEFLHSQGHVWTTPALQEESDVRLAVGCKSCVRPVCAAP